MSEDEFVDEDDGCPMCGGDGVVMLSECGPGEWGEDTFCEVDRIVPCPECREQRRREAMKQKGTNPTHE